MIPRVTWPMPYVAGDKNSWIRGAGSRPQSAALGLNSVSHKLLLIFVLVAGRRLSWPERWVRVCLCRRRGWMLTTTRMKTRVQLCASKSKRVVMLISPQVGFVFCCTCLYRVAQNLTSLCLLDWLFRMPKSLKQKLTDTYLVNLSGFCSL